MNEGRNAIRFNNSDGKCLIENWEEERRTKCMDPQGTVGEGGITSKAQMVKNGHKGVLTTDFGATVNRDTTMTASYRAPAKLPYRTRGIKEDLLERMLWEQATAEVLAEQEPEVVDPRQFYKSETKDQYTIEDFEHRPPAASRSHDVKYENPVTFWGEHRDKIHGHTQEKSHDQPWRKNTSFSKPSSESWDEPKPHELEPYSKM